MLAGRRVEAESERMSGVVVATSVLMSERCEDLITPAVLSFDSVVVDCVPHSCFLLGSCAGR